MMRSGPKLQKENSIFSIDNGTSTAEQVRLIGHILSNWSYFRHAGRGMMPLEELIDATPSSTLLGKASSPRKEVMMLMRIKQVIILLTLLPM